MRERENNAKKADKIITRDAAQRFADFSQGISSPLRRKIVPEEVVSKTDREHRDREDEQEEDGPPKRKYTQDIRPSPTRPACDLSCYEASRESAKG
jgi:hypothetical protein